jgi:hypothetical protein
MTLDPWLMILVAIGGVWLIVKFVVLFNQRMDRRDARRRNQARPWRDS